MKIKDTLRMRGTVEIWKHRDDQPYNEGVLLERRRNTVSDSGRRSYLGRLHYYTVPQIDEATEYSTDFGHPIDGISFHDTVNMVYRAKAIRKVYHDSDEITRYIATLYADEGVGLEIDELFMGSFGDHYVNTATITYSGSDIDMSSFFADNKVISQNHLMCGSRSGPVPHIFGRSTEYDPEREGIAPVVPRDYRVQKKSDGKWYIIVESGATYPPANPSDVYLVAAVQDNDIPVNNFQNYAISTPIIKSNVFAISVAWVNEIL